MSQALDAGARTLLREFGIADDALLGSGGEAWVFALDAERVLRVPRPGTSPSESALRSALLRELESVADCVPFELPRILEERCIDTRLATIEVRLPGRTLTHELADSRGDARRSLLRAHLDAANRIGDLAIERSYFGEIARDRAIEAPDSHTHLAAAVARSLERAGPEFAHFDPNELAAALPHCETRSLVHLDAFAGNMLARDGRITAVLDFGPLAMIGDRRLDPWTAAAYLAPEITPGATAEDWQIGQQWLAEHQLQRDFDAAHRWLAAFWSGAVDHPRLQAWSRRVLGIPSAP